MIPGMARRVVGKITIKQTRRVTVTRTVRTQIVPAVQSRPTITYSPPRAISPSRRIQYSQPEREFLGDVREAVIADVPRDRDVFLCHAWGDRSGVAADLFHELTALEVDAWFSEKDVILGRSLPRQLDAGLRVSRVGIVLVTPNLIQSLRTGGFADQELGALLSTDRVIPVSHGVTYDELRAESPLLATRAGLSTEESSIAEVAAKIAESVLDVDLP